MLGPSSDSPRFLDERFHAIEVALRDFLGGDKAAGTTLRLEFLGLSTAAEQFIAAGRLGTVCAARCSPHSASQAEAALALGQMCCGMFPDYGLSFFKYAQHWAEDCGNISLEREALLQTAELTFRVNNRADRCEQVYGLLREALSLDSTPEHKDFTQIVRANTLMANCYHIQYGGSVESETLDCVMEIESYLEKNRERVEVFLHCPEPAETAAFKTVLDGALQVADTLALSGDFEAARTRYTRLLDLIQPDSSLTTWGRVKVLHAFAKSINEYCKAVPPEQCGPEYTTTLYYHALCFVREAKMLIALQSEAFNDPVLHGKLLLQEGSILYDVKSPGPAFEAFRGALKFIESDSLNDDDCLQLVREICEEMELCKADIEEAGGNGGEPEPYDWSQDPE